MSDAFTSIGNPAFSSQTSSGWQMNFGDGNFGGAFAPAPQAGGDSLMMSTAAPGGGGGGGGVEANAANTSAGAQGWDASLAGFDQALSSQPWPVVGTSVSGDVAGSQSGDGKAAPGASTSAAPMVHIRERDDSVSMMFPADLCSLAPPPPVTNRQKQGAGDGQVISRQRPGSERPGSRRQSTQDLPSPSYDPNMSGRMMRAQGMQGFAQSIDIMQSLPAKVGDARPLALLSEEPAVQSIATTNAAVGPLGTPLVPVDLDAPQSLVDVQSSLGPGSTHTDLMGDGPLSITTMPAATGAVGTVISDSRSSDQAPTQGGDTSEWDITSEQREYYRAQFVSLADDQELVTGAKARGFFLKSRLPPSELSQIWRLSDVNGDGALNQAEFSVAMQLVFARRRGAALPDVLPVVLAKLCAEPPRAAFGNPLAAPSPSQLPLLDRTPPPSDSSSDEDETDAKVTPGGNWQGYTMSDTDGGKPALLPKPAAAKKPERPGQPPKRPGARPSLPAVPADSPLLGGNPPVPQSPRSAAVESRMVPQPAPRRSDPAKTQAGKSVTLGRGFHQSGGAAGWSAEAGDLIGRHDQSPEVAPRVPARNLGHQRGSSMGDPRQMSRITGAKDFSPPLPPREKHAPKEVNPVTELESVLEGRTSEMKKKLEGLGSPAHHPATSSHMISPVPVAEGSVAAAAAGLAQALQGSQPMIKQRTADPKVDVPLSPAGRTLPRRVAKKPDRPAAPPNLSSPGTDATRSLADAAAASGRTASAAKSSSAADIYASALPKSQRRGDVAADGPEVTSNDDAAGLEHTPSVKKKIAKCRDHLLALSAINQELQAELYKVREERLSLQYELERLAGETHQ